MSSISSSLQGERVASYMLSRQPFATSNGCPGMVVKLAPGIEPGWQTLSQASSGEPSGSSLARPKRSGTGSGRR